MPEFTEFTVELDDAEIDRITRWVEDWQQYADETNAPAAREIVANVGLLLAALNAARKGTADA
jgi:hypothetical protein